MPAILSFGSAFPSRKVTNEDIAKTMGRNPAVINRLMRTVGIEERHWVEQGKEATSDLSVKAVEQALKMSRIDKDRLKALWLATFSPNYLAVPVSPMVQDELELSTSTRICDISVACPGWIHALEISFTNMTSPYGNTGPQAVVGAEVISTSLDPREEETYMLFGDAAGAVITDIVDVDEGVVPVIAFVFGSDGSHAKDLYIPAGGSLEKTSEETVKAGKHSIHMKGKIVEEQAIRRMSESAVAVLKKAGVLLEDINLLIPHQANKKIILATADTLGIPEDKVFINIDHTANTSSATIPVALEEAFENGRLRRNDLVLYVSFGAGMNFAAAVITMVGLPKK